MNLFHVHYGLVTSRASFSSRTLDATMLVNRSATPKQCRKHHTRSRYHTALDWLFGLVDPGFRAPFHLVSKRLGVKRDCCCQRNKGHPFLQLHLPATPYNGNMVTVYTHVPMSEGWIPVTGHSQCYSYTILPPVLCSPGRISYKVAPKLQTSVLMPYRCIRVSSGLM